MRDALAVVGLVCVAVGCWLLHPAASFIVVGSVLVVVGIAGHFARGKP